MNEQNAPRGTAMPLPKQEEPQPPQWVTEEEAERYEKMLFKPFVRKKEKVEGESKKYVYQIVNICPSVPLGVLTMEGQNQVVFTIQKFYRDQFQKRELFDESGRRKGEVQTQQEVKWVAVNSKSGNAKVLDPDASFMIDSRRFEAEFKRDAE